MQRLLLARRPLRGQAGATPQLHSWHEASEASRWAHPRKPHCHLRPGSSTAPPLIPPATRALGAVGGPFSKAAGRPSPVNTGPTKLPLRRYSGTGLGPGGRWGGRPGACLSILDTGTWMSCSWSAGSVRLRSLERAGTGASLPRPWAGLGHGMEEVSGLTA